MYSMESIKYFAYLVHFFVLLFYFNDVEIFGCPVIYCCSIMLRISADDLRVLSPYQLSQQRRTFTRAQRKLWPSFKLYN